MVGAFLGVWLSAVFKRRHAPKRSISPTRQRTPFGTPSTDPPEPLMVTRWDIRRDQHEPAKDHGATDGSHDRRDISHADGSDRSHRHNPLQRLATDSPTTTERAQPGKAHHRRSQPTSPTHPLASRVRSASTSPVRPAREPSNHLVHTPRGRRNRPADTPRERERNGHLQSGPEMHFGARVEPGYLQENADLHGKVASRRRSKSAGPRRPDRMGPNHPGIRDIVLPDGQMQRYQSLSPLARDHTARGSPRSDVSDGLTPVHDTMRTYSLAGSPHRSTHKLEHHHTTIVADQGRESTV